MTLMENSSHKKAVLTMKILTNGAITVALTPVMMKHSGKKRERKKRHEVLLVTNPDSLPISNPTTSDELWAIQML